MRPDIIILPLHGSVGDAPLPRVWELEQWEVGHLQWQVTQLQREVAQLQQAVAQLQKLTAPPVTLPPVCKRGRPRATWIFHALRYDEFLTLQQIAKAAGHSRGTTNAQLHAWEKRGYVQHVEGKGWRKDAKVEELEDLRKPKP